MKTINSGKTEISQHFFQAPNPISQEIFLYLQTWVQKEKSLFWFPVMISMHGFFLSAARHDTYTCIRPRRWSQTHQQGFQVKSRLGVPDKSLQPRQAAFLSALRSRHDSRTVSPDQITLKLQQRQRSSGKTTGGWLVSGTRSPCALGLVHFMSTQVCAG